MPEYIEYKPERARSRGSVEVICGSMFSGKTEELIRRLKRSRIARQKVEVFKPSVDMRYDDIAVVSHDENSLGATVVDTPSQILLMTGEDTDVVGIDEAQFFDLSLVDVCNTLADMGIRVIIAGLDMDYLGIPFGPIPGLMAVAEFVTKVRAICQECGDPALYSHRIVSNDNLVLLGEKESYVPLCRNCYKEMRKIRSKSEKKTE